MLTRPVKACHGPTYKRPGSLSQYLSALAMYCITLCLTLPQDTPSVSVFACNKLHVEKALFQNALYTISLYVLKTKVLVL